jgi:hypothetical protein
MIPYQTKSNLLPGTNLGETARSARKIFREIEKSTKRRAYIRSAYFKKEKIFFDFFWDHLAQKSPRERLKRLKYFKVTIDLIEHSRNKPSFRENPNKKSETLYRFAGLTKEKLLFYVQIKEDKKTKRKYLMSCFPPE